MLEGLRILLISTLLAGVTVAAVPAEHAGPPQGWRPFAADSPWNTPIPADPPLEPDGAAYLAALARTAGGPWIGINIRKWSIPVYWVDLETTPRYDIGRIGPWFFNEIVDPDADGIARDIPIPEGALPDPMNDAHMCVADWRAGVAYDFLAFKKRQPGDLRTRALDRWDLNGAGVHAPGVTSCRGSGFPLLAGLILPGEIAAGEIEHALALATPLNDPYFYAYPASQTDGFARGELALPEGARLQLDPALDLRPFNLSPAGWAIARALQVYGAYICDNAGGFALYAQNTDAWTGVLEGNAIGNIGIEHFRVLKIEHTRFQPYDPAKEIAWFDLRPPVMVE